jgi:adenylate kinase
VFNVHTSPPRVDGKCDNCGTTLEQRSDDVPETIQRRLQVYRDQTAPLISFYENDGVRFERIRADRPVGAVYADFKEAVEAAR